MEERERDHRSRTQLNVREDDLDNPEVLRTEQEIYIVPKANNSEKNENSTNHKEGIEGRETPDNDRVKRNVERANEKSTAASTRSITIVAIRP